MFGIGRKPSPSRLDNWDGRRHSSKGEPAVLPRAWNRPLVFRLCVVCCTVLGITALLVFRDPIFPYRVGETLPNDIRARVTFDLLNELSISPTEDSEFVEEYAKIERYQAGNLLARQGQKITFAKWTLLQAEQRAYHNQRPWHRQAVRGLSLFLILMLLAALLAVYVSRFQQRLAEHASSLVGICVLIFSTIALSFYLLQSPWNTEIIPLTLTAMILAFVYNPPFAMLMSFSMAIVMALADGFRLAPMLINSGGMATAILLMKGIRYRIRPVEVGAWAGVAYLGMTVAVGILTNCSAELLFLDSGRHFLWSLLAGCILSGSLPLIEKMFGIITDTTLLELADGSHPLLQELVRRAPGTYTHSMTVATLAEAAAEAIDANGLLVRVGSYYHDIGKMMKPDYFIENQTGENRHDNLEPALSTLVIIGHIKDGVALAKEYRLPTAIVDLVQQHHGTTLVEYFYREAMRLQEVNGHGANELEYAFRYPGPKPQTREAGILMLSDAVESASRAIQNPTSNTLRKLVHEMLMKRLLDGQFDESGLSLAELRQIEETLVKSLTAIYHARIRYPQSESTVKQVS